MMRRLLYHVGNYGSAQILATVAGFVSFPVLTRILSVEDYGVMSLISSTLMLLVIVGKLGVQQSVMRFRCSTSDGDGAGAQGVTLTQFYSTALLGMGAAGLVIAVLWGALSQTMSQHWWGDPRISSLMGLSAVLVFLRVVDSALMNMLRGEQRSGTHSLAVVLKRYGQLALVLACVGVLWPTLNGYYIGVITAEILSLLVLLPVVLRNVKIKVQEFSMPLYKAMLGFGLPMIVYEFGASILNLGDRFVVNAVMGSQALGEYAAAYNVCEYVQAIAIVSVTQALVPMYTRMWHEQGVQATTRFLERAFHFYIVIAAALVAAMVTGGPDLLNIVASSKYGHGAPIIPWVVSGLVLDGATTILGAGLFAAKKTRTVMWGVVASAILNIGLNFILVPWAGLVGAGAATLLSYALLCLFVARAGREYLAVRLPWLAMARLGALAALAYLGCEQLEWGSGLGAVLLRLAAGTLAYLALVVVFDRRCQELAAQGWQQLALWMRSRGHAARQGASS